MNNNTCSGTLIYEMKGPVEEEFTSIKFLLEQMMDKEKNSLKPCMILKIGKMN